MPELSKKWKKFQKMSYLHSDPAEDNKSIDLNDLFWLYTYNIYERQIYGYKTHAHGRLDVIYGNLGF